MESCEDVHLCATLRAPFNWAFPGEEVRGVPVAQVGLDLEHGRPAEAGVALHPRRPGGSRFGWAGLVLKQLEECGHIRSQSGHQPGSHHLHGVFVTLHQALQKCAVVPATPNALECTVEYTYFIQEFQNVKFCYHLHLAYGVPFSEKHKLWKNFT